MADFAELLRHVDRALGRSGPVSAPPPPAIDPTLVRLVHTDIGLPELFAARAAENSILVQFATPDELTDKIATFLREKSCQRIALAESKLLEQLSVRAKLESAGLHVSPADDLTQDQLFEYDCGVTDAWCAVAEVGALVMRARPECGQGLSLIPPIHVAVLQPADFVADLVDLFERIGRAEPVSNLTIITGPSKTSDIEMNLVTGVHGPGTVAVFILK